METEAVRPQAKEHLFFINPVSFLKQDGIRSFVSEVDKAFRKLPGHHYTAMVSRFPRDAIGMARRYVAKKAEEGKTVRVYAVGGDGILFDCLNAIMGMGNAELTNIPFGTHNDFLRAFGEEAPPLFKDIEHLAVSPSVATDVLNCDNTFALNFASVGLESLAIMRTVAVKKRLWKWRGALRSLHPLMYAAAASYEAFRRPVLRQRYEVVIDDVDRCGVFCAINIANGPCYGGDKLSNVRALPNDGLMDVSLYRMESPWGIMRAMPGNLRDDKDEPRKYVTRLVAQSIEIASDTPLHMALDGEVFFDTHARIEIMPAAVRFIAPERLAYERRLYHD